MECKTKRIADRKNTTETFSLITCKSWNGSCATQDELESILASKPSIQEKIVKVERT